AMHTTTPDAVALIAAAMFLAGFHRRRHLALAAIGGNMQVNTIDAWDAADVLQVPELPRAGERWTLKRKAAVADAVGGGWVAINQGCVLYNLTIDELVAWERDLDRYGMPGLRTTRYQIYRDTEKKSA